ncbi:ergothioneine biosynthesis protein EgtB [Pseudomonadota bacterium]
MTLPQQQSPGSTEKSLLQRYRSVRQASLDLAAPLELEDMVIQSMPDCSPTRWHLAHVTWFFEHFLLSRDKAYRPYREGWDYLFNSYYYSVGDMYKRPQRGLLSRPTVAEVLAYRQHVDQCMAERIPGFEGDPELEFLVTLGLNHEQQHQELMLTDIKHAFSLNPLKPAYRKDLEAPARMHSALNFIEFPGGIVEIGADGEGFCFDNETPRHRTLLIPFRLASRPVSNAEYRGFIEDGGYRRSEYWLSEGWAAVQTRHWERPIYWSRDLDCEYSLLGEIALDPDGPVCHVSYFEADAYARWAGARLPTEAEWEQAAATEPVDGNLLDAGCFHPNSSGADGRLSQIFGDTWEWTRSAYSAYPGFKPLAGSLGEYNGKFMCGQLVLRGGSCVTPASHIRASYRNFFYPDARWQFSGIRLAADG